MSEISPIELSLHAYLENCIVYHEGVITKYDLMRTRLLQSQLADRRAMAAIARSIGHAEAALERLHTARQSLGNDTEGS